MPMAKKSLAGRDTDKNSKLKDDKIRKPKKAKSSTNLASLLSRPKSTKSLRKAAAEEELRLGRDKENRSPPSSSLTDSESTPPIYAQFATQHFAVQPLGGKFLEDEIDLYTPQQYSPGKQRNFYNGPGSQPTLNRRDETKRALSTYLPSNFSIQDISRHVGGSERRSAERQRGGSFDLRPAIDRKATMPETKAELTTSRRGARVMAAVASFGSKAKPVEPAAYPVPDIKDVDAEFEAMLDRRNIPEHQRYKMRSLATSMKIDFVKQDWAEASSAQRDRPSKTSSAENGADAKNESHNPTVQTKRPRSLTFTLSKSSKEYTSSTKKTGPDSVLGLHSRSKSTDSTPTYTRYLTSSSAAAASTLIAKAKGQLPDDFVAYLRRIQKPESVEVGRLHKLRLLLRNETVAWTDGFIELGGMKEIVALLQRTMKVEWRSVFNLFTFHQSGLHYNT